MGLRGLQGESEHTRELPGGHEETRPGLRGSDGPLQREHRPTIRKPRALLQDVPAKQSIALSLAGMWPFGPYQHSGVCLCWLRCGPRGVWTPDWPCVFDSQVTLGTLTRGSSRGTRSTWHSGRAPPAPLSRHCTQSGCHKRLSVANGLF